MLLVLDQFEQWLHAKRGQENTELVAALRHCDGERVQAVVLVRDDFWLAASRFMQELEIDLVPDRNIALVDLFDQRHARKVLVAFGRAYGTLPEKRDDLSRDQQTFLDEAISELTQDGKIVSVRLALFAEMVKAKSWDPGDVAGHWRYGRRRCYVPRRNLWLGPGQSQTQATPESRPGGVEALLPESGTDIKGRMRSRQELRDASGYANRPRDFDDLIHVLDPELRLITPTDPDGFATETQATLPGGRYYQLTHDYLVHSLRGWLTRKRRETPRGRAALRLSERSASWNAKPENRQLPSALEWANIRVLTSEEGLDRTQRRVMRRGTSARLPRCVDHCTSEYRDSAPASPRVDISTRARESSMLADW